MHQSQPEAILNAAELHQPGYIKSESEDLPELQSFSSEEALVERPKSPTGDKEQHNPCLSGKFWDSTDSDTPIAAPDKEADATPYLTGLDVIYDTPAQQCNFINATPSSPANQEIPDTTSLKIRKTPPARS